MDSPPPPPPPRNSADVPLPRATSRRAFLGRAAATATVAALWLEGALDPRRAQRTRPTRDGEGRRTLSDAEWKTLEAAQVRILPSGEGSPGAREVNAIGYLDAVLADAAIDEETVARVKRGAARLDGFARSRGGASFAALEDVAQDAGLRLFEADWASQLWLRSMITFVMEAFLGDPSHGGNPDGIGWTWAGHEPGRPRPKPGWRPIGEGPEK